MHKAYNFVRAACVRVRAGNKAKKRENVSMKLFSFFLLITHTRKHTHSHTQHTHCFSPSHTLFLSFKPILFSFECLGTKLRVQHKSHLQKSNQVSSYDFSLEMNILVGTTTYCTHCLASTPSAVTLIFFTLPYLGTQWY